MGWVLSQIIWFGKTVPLSNSGRMVIVISLEEARQVVALLVDETFRLKSVVWVNGPGS